MEEEVRQFPQIHIVTNVADTAATATAAAHTQYYTHRNRVPFLHFTIHLPFTLLFYFIKIIKNELKPLSLYAPLPYLRERERERET